MTPYAEVPEYRTRQILSDIAMAVWLIGWLIVGRRLFNVIDRLGDPGRSVEGAAAGLARRFDSIADGVGDIPLAGDELQGPFEAVVRGFQSLESAGATQADALYQTARSISTVAVLLPILYALFWYVPKRVSWMKEAAAARSLRGTAAASILAHRFVSRRPVESVVVVAPDAAEKLRAGDYQELIEAELTALGLRST